MTSDLCLIPGISARVFSIYVGAWDLDAGVAEAAHDFGSGDVVVLAKMPVAEQEKQDRIVDLRLSAQRQNTSTLAYKTFPDDLVRGQLRLPGRRGYQMFEGGGVTLHEVGCSLDLQFVLSDLHSQP